MIFLKAWTFLKTCFLMKTKVVVSIYLQDALRLEHHNLSYEANHGHPLNAVGAYFSYIHTLKAYIYTVPKEKPKKRWKNDGHARRSVLYLSIPKQSR